MKGGGLISVLLFTSFIQVNCGQYNLGKETDATGNAKISELISKNKDEMIEVLKVCTKATFDGTPTITPMKYMERKVTSKHNPRQYTFVELKITDSKETRFTAARFFRRLKNAKTHFTHIGRNGLRSSTEPLTIKLEKYQPANADDCNSGKKY